VGEAPSHYDKLDADGRKYYLKPLRAMGGQGDFPPQPVPLCTSPFTHQTGVKYFQSDQDGTDGAWRWNKEKVEAEENTESTGSQAGMDGPRTIVSIAESETLRPPETIWEA